MKLKTFEEILFGMIVWFKGLSKKVTDFNIGSTIRTIMESVAIEIEEIYAKLSTVIEEVVRESAYKAFGFNILPAIPAYARVRFSIGIGSSTFVIPKGTRVSTSENITFSVISNITVDSGLATKDVLVKCLETGHIGNVDINTITRIVDHITGLTSVTNPLPAIGGEEREPASKRTQRFAQFVNSLSRGTKTSIEYALSTIPEITSVNLYEPVPGVIQIYISNAQGIVDSALIDAATSKVNDYRAAGVKTEVYSIHLYKVRIQVNVYINYLANMAFVKNRVYYGILDYLNNTSVGTDLVLSHMKSSIFNTNKDMIRDVTITYLLITDKDDVTIAEYNSNTLPSRYNINEKVILRPSEYFVENDVNVELFVDV